MIINLGIYIYFFPIAAPVISALIGFFRKEKPCRMLVTAFIVYGLTVNILNCIFPLHLGESLPEFPVNKDFWIYGIGVPFWHWGDMDIFVLRDAFQVNISSCIFGAVVAFALTLSVKMFRKISAALIFSFSTETIFMLATLLPNIILGGLNKVFRCNSGIFYILFYLIGFLLAKLVIRFTPGITTLFDGKRTEKRTDEAFF